MCDSKPLRCFQQHNPLKVKRNETNRDKHINKASKQTFATNYFKISCKYTQGLFSNWKICFNVFNLHTLNKLFCNLDKINETVMWRSCTIFSIWCQQTTKTTSKCNANSFVPVCHFWSVTLKCMRDSRPECDVQQH